MALRERVRRDSLLHTSASLEVTQSGWLSLHQLSQPDWPGRHAHSNKGKQLVQRLANMSPRMRRSTVKRRWFELRGADLRHSALDPNGRDSTGAAPSSRKLRLRSSGQTDVDTIAFESVLQQEEHRLIDKMGAWQFQLTCQDGAIWVLAADSARSRATWVKAMQNGLRELKDEQKEQRELKLTVPAEQMASIPLVECQDENAWQVDREWIDASGRQLGGHYLVAIGGRRLHGLGCATVRSLLSNAEQHGAQLTFRDARHFIPARRRASLADHRMRHVLAGEGGEKVFDRGQSPVASSTQSSTQSLSSARSLSPRTPTQMKRSGILMRRVRTAVRLRTLGQGDVWDTSQGESHGGGNTEEQRILITASEEARAKMASYWIEDAFSGGNIEHGASTMMGKPRYIFKIFCVHRHWRWKGTVLLAGIVHMLLGLLDSYFDQIAVKSPDAVELTRTWRWRGYWLHLLHPAGDSITFGSVDADAAALTDLAGIGWLLQKLVWGVAVAFSRVVASMVTAAFGVPLTLFDMGHFGLSEQAYIGGDASRTELVLRVHLSRLDFAINVLCVLIFLFDIFMGVVVQGGLRSYFAKKKGKFWQRFYVPVVLLLGADCLVLQGRFTRPLRPLVLALRENQVRRHFTTIISMLPALRSVAVPMLFVLVAHAIFASRVIGCSVSAPWTLAYGLNYTCHSALSADNLTWSAARDFGDSTAALRSLVVVMTSLDTLDNIFTVCVESLGHVGLAFIVSFVVMAVILGTSLFLAVVFDAHQVQTSRRQRMRQQSQTRALFMAFTMMDVNGNGLLSLPMFSALLRRLMRPQMVPDKICCDAYALLGHQTRVRADTLQEGRQESETKATVIDGVDFLDLRAVLQYARGAMYEHHENKRRAKSKPSAERARLSRWVRVVNKSWYMKLRQTLALFDMLAFVLDLECFPIARLPQSTLEPDYTSTSALATTVCNCTGASLDMRFPPADIALTLNHVSLLLNLLGMVPIVLVGGLRKYWTACDIYHRIDVAVLLLSCIAMLTPGIQVLTCFFVAALGLHSPQTCVAHACVAEQFDANMSSEAMFLPWLLLSLLPCNSKLSMLRLLRIPAFVPSIQRFFGTIVVGVFPILLPTVALSVSISYIYAAVAVDYLSLKMSCFTNLETSFWTFTRLTFGAELHEVSRQAQGWREGLLVISFMLIQVMIVQSVVTAVIVEFYNRTMITSRESGGQLSLLHRRKREAKLTEMHDQISNNMSDGLYQWLSPFRGFGGERRPADAPKRVHTLGTQNFSTELLFDATEWVRNKLQTDFECLAVDSHSQPHVQDLTQVHRVKDVHTHDRGNVR